MTVLEPLRAEGFGRRYQRTRPWAVRDLTFAVPQGSITALVGPNGSGKLTLLKSCIGFERPDEGQLLVAGADPVKARAEVVDAVGYVPQANALYRSLTIADHFQFAVAARRRFDRGLALDRVASAGLSPDRRVGSLSGGEQAQVSLALALGTRADLLLLDEPLASLDPLARRDFLTTLVDDVKGRGATVVLSSHIVTDVEQACDRIVVLAQGRLALDMAVSVATETFRTVEGAGKGARAPIGTFPGPTGAPITLIRDESEGRSATLEEIVLGHLAAARAKPRSDA